jgi:hypothetical protein
MKIEPSHFHHHETHFGIEIEITCNDTIYHFENDARKTYSVITHQSSSVVAPSLQCWRGVETRTTK